MATLKIGDILVARVSSMINITKGNEYKIYRASKKMYYIKDDKGKSHGFLIDEVLHYFNILIFEQNKDDKTLLIKEGEKWVNKINGDIVKIKWADNNDISYRDSGGYAFMLERKDFLEDFTPKPTKKETEPKQIKVGSRWVGKGYGDKVKVIEVKDGNVTLSCKKYKKTDDNSLPIDIFLHLFTPRQPKPTKKQKLVKFLEWLDNPTLKGYSKEELAYLYLEYLKQK